MAAFSRISHDTHSTTSNSTWSTRRIAITALLCALAFILTFVEIPIFPLAPWLEYDPSGIVAFIAALVFGASTGTVVVVLPWVLKTLFSFNIYGHIMAIVASLALVIPASLIARRIPNRRGLICGMILGCIVALVACVLCNIVITPLYTAVSTADVIAMIVPVLLPFNFIKVVINCVVTAFIRKPVEQAFSV